MIRTEEEYWNERFNEEHLNGKIGKENTYDLKS